MATYTGTASANTIYTSYENDVVEALGGDDLLYWLGGYDRVDGGTEQDTLSFFHSYSAVWVSLIEGYAWTRGTTNLSSGTWTTIASLTGVENIVGSYSDDYLQGDNGNNRLEGSYGNDQFMFSGGRDLYLGGAGADTLNFSQVGPGRYVQIELALQKAWLWEGSAWTIVADLDQVENIVGTPNDDILKGDSSDNVFTGGSGNDQFIYSAGYDTIIGGEGQDWFFLTQAPGRVWVDLGGGGTEVWLDSGSGWQQAAELSGVEDVTGSPYSDYLKGDAGNNTLYGLGGKDWYVYSGGYDTIIEFLGGHRIGEDDKLDMSGAAGRVWVDLGGGGTEAWVLEPSTGWRPAVDVTGVESVVGGAYDDYFKGFTTVTETFLGGAGDDYFQISFGKEFGTDQYEDILVGGSGVDTASFSTVGPSDVSLDYSRTGLTIDLAIDSATSYQNAGGSYYYHVRVATLAEIENIEGSAYNDSIKGDGENNRLSGREGNDLFLESGGTDTYYGGSGSDVWDADYSSIHYAVTNNGNGDWYVLNTVTGGQNYIYSTETLRFADVDLTV